MLLIRLIPVVSPGAVRVVRTKEFGDINISTMLSLMMLVGLAVIPTL